MTMSYYEVGSRVSHVSCLLLYGDVSATPAGQLLPRWAQHHLL